MSDTDTPTNGDEAETGISAEDQAQAEALAAEQAHPHNRIKKVLADLSVKEVDLPARMAQLHHAVANLAQIILSHTPPPDNGDKNG